jgi:LacI family transcriptional regulator
MTSIKVVARHAGVSIATVSRVLNGTKFVSADVREKVLAAIAELNYQPNVTARNLRRQRTQSVGVLVPQLNDIFFSNLAFAIEKALFAQGYSPLFSSTEENMEKEIACVNILIQNRVEGVILVPSIPPGHSINQVQRLIDRDIPVVLLDRRLPQVRVTQVLSNHYQGAYDTIRYLLDLGHRHIGIVDTGVVGMAAHFGPGFERLRGARQALLDADVPFDDSLVFIEPLAAIEIGYQGTLKLLRQSPQITAIFALTDTHALGVLQAAFELGLNVPRDLSVVGFADLPLASHVIPRLTTMAQPLDKIGQTAVERLLRQIREPDAHFETIMIGTQLVVRQSTAPPRR